MAKNINHRQKRTASQLPASSSYLRHTLIRWTGPAIIAVVALAMIVWQWRTWPDPFIDFGRELYIPWQLNLAKHLYTDIAYFNGPLSPYFNALIFRLFGASLTTIILVNLILTGVILTLLYRMILRVSDRFTAAVAGITFAAVFAFGNIQTCGNFNYVCPYSHEATHGLLLALIAITFLDTYRDHPKNLYLVLLGLSLGLCFLTKAECFLAAIAAVTGSVFIVWIAEKRRWSRRSFYAILITAASAAIPILIAHACLARFLPAKQAFQGILGGWAWIGNHRITELPFYKAIIGLDDFPMRLTTIARWLGFYASVLIPTALLDRFTPKQFRYGFVGFLMIAGIAAIWTVPHIAKSYTDLIKPLPVIIFFSLGITIFRICVKRFHCDNPIRTKRFVTLLIFALAICLKMIFNCSVTGYGFVLAMPATLMTVVILLNGFPNTVFRKGPLPGMIFKTASLTLVALLIFTELYMMSGQRQQRTVTVAGAGDGFYANIKGAYLNSLLDFLRQNVPPDKTLAVLPEGVMANYLARRVNPTPYINFMPPEIIMFGEKQIIEAFDRHPPDYIAIVHKDTAIYGVRFFGKHYAQDLFDWINRHYTPLIQIGDPPLVDYRFGIVLLKRNSPEPGNNT